MKEAIEEMEESSLKERKEEGYIKGLQTIARYRMGNETRTNRYWEKEENRKYRLCKKEEETTKHINEECEFTVIKGEENTWERKINGKKEDVARMFEINWKREQKRKQEEDEGNEQDNDASETQQWIRGMWNGQVRASIQS